MKKTIIISSLLVVFFSCTKKRKTHFEGYVYYSNEPLKNVTVRENLIDVISVKTDSTGYFKLKREFENFASKLIFKKEGFITDTINLVGSGNPGQMPETLFLRERKDTLFMKPLNNSKSKE